MESVPATAERIRAKVGRYAVRLLDACRAVSDEYAVPVVNKRLAVTPIAHVGAGFDRDGFILLGRALDEAAAEVGVDFVGGFSANVEGGLSGGDLALIAAIPETLATTDRVCGSVNVGSTRYGINMDAVRLIGQTVYDLGWRSADRGGFAAAKFVVFANQPADNPFMAGAIHGVGQPEAVINVGVSGPGVVARALERLIDGHQPGELGLHDLADEIKRTAFRVTRSGELIGKRVAQLMDVPFGIVDLSLAPTPQPGRQRGRDPQAPGRGRDRRARLDRHPGAAERRGQEGRRLRQPERRRAERRIHPRVGGCRARGRGPRRQPDAREAGGDDQRLLGGAGHDPHPRLDRSRDHRRTDRRRDGDRHDQRQDDRRAPHPGAGTRSRRVGELWRAVRRERRHAGARGGAIRPVHRLRRQDPGADPQPAQLGRTPLTGLVNEDEVLAGLTTNDRAR